MLVVGYKRIAWIGLSLFAVVACTGTEDTKKSPGSGGTGAQSGPAALSADEKACEDLYRVELAFAGRCGGLLNGSQPTISRFRTFCARQLAAPGAEALRDARSKCAERLQTAACDEDLLECELPQGSLADGAPCAGREQCASRFCKLDHGSCGTCAPLVAAGGECSSAADCAASKGEVPSCDYKSGATTGTCSVWKVAKAGQTCSSQAFCDARSHCDVPDKNAKSGICVANFETGKSCDDTRSCRPGLVCANKKCAPKPKEGEPCDAIDACDEGLACDSTCKKVEYVGVNQKCDSVRRCARGRCVQPVTQDQDGRTTPSGDAYCVDPIADGQPCGEEAAKNGAVCDVFAQCIGGMCMLADPSQCK